MCINISFFSFGKVYSTEFTKISQIESTVDSQRQKL